MPDFETIHSASVRVQVKDAAGASIEAAFTITINDVNEAPVQLALSNTTLNENNAVHTFVGKLTATDRDRNEQFSYAQSGADASAFKIEGDQLFIETVADFDKQTSYTITIRVTDKGNNTYDQTFTLNVNNTIEALKQASKEVTEQSIFGSNGMTDNNTRLITNDLFFPSKSSDGAKITYTVTPSGYIDPVTGEITGRPSFTQGDQTVTMTVISTLPDGTKESKTFTVVVKAAPISSKEQLEQAAAEAAKQSDLKNNLSVTPDEDRLNLPSSGAFDTLISYQFTPAGYIDPVTGEILKRPAFGEQPLSIQTTVTYTAPDGTKITKPVTIVLQPAAEDIRGQLLQVASEIKPGGAANMDAITGNLSLPSTGAFGTKITWKSSKPELISADGTVQPALRDEKVRLVAVIEKDGFFREVEYFVTVKGSSEVDLAKDMSALNITFADAVGSQQADSASAVTRSVFLPVRGATGSEIKWTSSHPAAIDPATGRVTRPAPGEADQTVTLSATLTVPGSNPPVTETKTYTLTVKALSDFDAAIDAARNMTPEAAFSMLELGDTWESVTNPFLLTKRGKYDTTISWTSSDPSVISISYREDQMISTVTRQDVDRTVVLTSTFNKNGKTTTKRFMIVVKAKEVSKDLKNTRQHQGSIQAEASVNGEEKTSELNVYRTVLDDQKKIDTVIIQETVLEKLTESIDPTENTGNRTVKIALNKVPSQADEMAFELNAGAVSRLADRKAVLEIVTNEGTIKLDDQTVRTIEQTGTDLYFRIVPIKDTAEKEQLMNDLSSFSNDAVPLGTARKIEANYNGYKTKLVLPLTGIRIPRSSAAVMNEFLSTLQVYVEHNDETKLYTGTPVFDAAGEPVGLEIEIEKFSKFQIVSVNKTVVFNTEIAYVAGYEGNLFKPSNPMTRAEIAGVLSKIVKSSSPVDGAEAVNPESTDVPATHWAANAIRNVKTKSWMKGYSDGSFRPEQSITRAEFAAVIARMIDPQAQAANPVSAQPMKDIATHWARTSIETLINKGIMNGYPDGSFRPDATITRAEVVIVLNRIMERTARPATTSSPFVDLKPTFWAYGDILEAALPKTN